MTPSQFRKMALTVPGAVESAHMNHPDFRIGGKIFATLGYPDDAHAMVKLTPEQQRQFIAQFAAVFSPCAGAWGRAGSTQVQLEAATPTMVRTALTAAAESFSGAKQRR
jgi:hypothetical protein